MSTALAELVVKLTGDISEFESSMEKAGGAMKGIGDNMAAVGTAVVAGAAVAGAALIGLGASSIGVASDFQSQMAIMSTAVDPVSLGVESAAEAMGILSDASLAVGSDTALVGVSASGAAESITGLYKAGMTTSEIFGDLNGYLAGTSELGGALRASIDLAAASELDMVAASDLAAVTLATFGGELTTAAERSDFVNSAMNNFVQTADASVASVQDLADAFVNVGPTAAAMGMGVEQVNTALGIMSMRGITGAEAGTQLKSMLLGMQADASNAGGALAELGVSLYDMDGAMRPLPDVIGDLEAAMSGMTEQQRNQYVATIAGTYGMNALNSLLAEGSTGWDEMTTAIGNAATMQETAAARANTFQGAMESLGGVVEAFQISIGTALIPVLTALADLGGMLLERFGPALTGVFETVGSVMLAIGTAATQFFTALEAGEAPMDALVNALMRLGQELGMPVAQLAEIRTKLDSFLAGVSSVLGPIATAITQFVSWKDVLVALGLAVASVVIPAIIGIVAAAAPVILTFMAVVAAVALLRNAWEQNWGGIQEKTAAVVALVRGWIEGLISWWNAAWPSIQATIQTVWGIIQTAIQTAVSIIGPTVQNMIATIQAAFAGGEPFINKFKELWTSLGPLFQSIVPILGAVVTLIVGLFNGILSAVGPLVSGIMGGIQAIIGIFTGLVTFVTGFWNTIVGLFTGNQEKVQQGLQQMGDGIRAIWENLVSGVISLVTGFVDAIKGFVQGLVDGVVQFFTNMYQAIVGGSIVPDLVNGVMSWFQNLQATLLSIMEAIRGFFEAIWNAIKALVEAVWQAMVAIVTGNITSIQSIIQTVWSAVQSFWQSIWTAIQTVTTTIWNSIKSLIETTINTVRGIIQAFISAIQGAWNAFAGVLYQTWNTAWTGIKNIFLGAYTTLTGIAGSIVNAIFSVFDKDWGSIGRNIVESIGNALMDGLRWVADKAAGIAQAALDAAMSALGIGSPSKEFIWLAEMAIEGFTRPWKDVRPIEGAVVRAMERGMDAGTRATTQTINRGVSIQNVTLPGANGATLIRQFEAMGARR